MILTRHVVPGGSRWAADGMLLPFDFSLGGFLAKPDTAILPTALSATGYPLIAPIEADQEVWASGVTYLRSRQEREAESTVADVYATVYDAARPEIFFKATGWRVVGPDAPIRIRRDSDWNVPEPELTLVISAAGKIVGYLAGNDVSSRSIEGENPLYLPQAKCYDGSCALGTGIILASEYELVDLAIELNIQRGGKSVFTGSARTSDMKRRLGELAEYLFREMSFPRGAFLMTGTGIVPAFPFTLSPGDRVDISVGEARLSNPVAS